MGASACHGEKLPALPRPARAKKASRGSPKPQEDSEAQLEAKRTRGQSGLTVGVRCAQREIKGHDSKPRPVSLVIFDLDETLTLTTFMSKDGTYTRDQSKAAAMINFESPWLTGSRLRMLKQMLVDLTRGKNGQTRTLAILTMNRNAGGISAVISLLKIAGIAEYFSVAWNMNVRPNRPSGAYRKGDKWKFFDPPFHEVHGHKAHVLQSIAQHVKRWIPNVGQKDGPALPDAMMPEEIVLVDDQRSNFQSDRGAKVVRYCKVARYDAEYHDFGLLKQMGGIGARDPRDFPMLVRFVEDPQDFEESLQCSCVQLDGTGRHAVKLVVFDFDETMTLATFMPEDPAFEKEVGRTPQDSGWTTADLVKYNFESPWASGSRIQQLKSMLTNLAQDEDGHPRTLAVLARNPNSVVAVLNLLLMAGLAEHFSAVWRLPQNDGIPDGVYLQGSQWRHFILPLSDWSCDHLTAADVLYSIAEKTSDWFPQLRGKDSSMGEDLSSLVPQEIALVSDDRADFWSNRVNRTAVARYCKVMRYDEDYRDCGYLQSMGGIGAHCVTDYHTILNFVERPSDFPYKGRRSQTLPAEEWQCVSKKSEDMMCQKSEDMMCQVSTLHRESNPEESASDSPANMQRIRSRKPRPVEGHRVGQQA